MVTTKAGHALMIDLLFDLKKETINAMGATIVNGFCPLCKQKRDECSEVNNSQNKMEITQKIHDWFKTHQIYRLHYLTNGLDKFTVI
ncbi:hypothetical protein VST22_17550 [Bacillus paranthracis]|nr:hypothetical protein [Bacillus paranthracis]MEC4604773.1 hypothetical protein [Bacillus paranthracis]